MSSVLLFVFGRQEDVAQNASQSEMRPVYGDECFTRLEVHVWCIKFAHGHKSVVDEARPGRQVVSMTNATTAAVDSLRWSDQRVMR